MVELAIYMFRLILAALVGLVVFLVVCGLVLLLVAMIDMSTGARAPEALVLVVATGAFILALTVIRFVWARWLCPRDKELEFWREVADRARRGDAPTAEEKASPRASVQLTTDGLSFKNPTGHVEITWLELREIRVRTFRDSFAGPLFVMIKKDGNTEALSQEEVPPEVLARIQRLPAFRNDALIEAMGSMTDGEFTCWRQEEPSS